MTRRITAFLLTFVLAASFLPAYASEIMGIVSFSSGVAGEPSPYPDITLPVGSKYTLPAGPETGPFGMTFRNWTVSGQGTHLPGDVITVEFRTYVSPNWDPPSSWGGTSGSTDTVQMGEIHFTKGVLNEQAYPTEKAPVGSTFTLPPAPAPGILPVPFLYWEIDGVRYDPGDTATVKSMTIVAAVWDIFPNGTTPPSSDTGTATLTFFSGWSPGVGKPSPGNMEEITLPVGSTCVLPEPTFRAPSGKYFIGWLIHEQFYSPGERIVLDRDYFATAAWESDNRDWSDLDSFTVHVRVDMGVGGTVSPSGEVTVPRGESLTITMTPDPGYYLAVLQINGRTTDPTHTLTLHSISTPYIVNAMFLPTKDGVSPPAPQPQYPAPVPVPDMPEIPPTAADPVIPSFPVIPEMPAEPEIFVPPAVSEPEPEPRLYEDVPNESWYAPDVAFVTEQGLMNGVGGGLFDPDDITSRAMLVTILWRMEGEPAAGSYADFSDVPGDTWYTDAVRWASSRGIVNGYGDGLFGPGDPLTREQMLTILHRYARQKQWTDNSRLPIARQYGYSDWAEDSVFWGDNCGILENWGVDITDQTAAVPRSEAAAALTRFCRNVRP